MFALAAVGEQIGCADSAFAAGDNLRIRWTPAAHGNDHDAVFLASPIKGFRDLPRNKSADRRLADSLSSTNYGNGGLRGKFMERRRRKNKICALIFGPSCEREAGEPEPLPVS